MPGSDRNDTGRATGRPKMESLDDRWAVGTTPLLPDLGRRTLTALVALLVLFGILYLLGT